MKASKPVFKKNTSELPADYKLPTKKKKYRKGPRRLVRSRRRNEFIPKDTDWCEINGQKLRQDIFFGEKRGRKFIPGRLLGEAPDFFVPNGNGAELEEAPFYGDGGDGGCSCGCACEGCVCGEGEGCSCSGPGTDSDVGTGAQDAIGPTQSGEEVGPSYTGGEEVGPSYTGEEVGPSYTGEEVGPSYTGEEVGPAQTSFDVGPSYTGEAGPGFNNTTDASAMFGMDDPSDIGLGLGPAFADDNLGSLDVGGPGVFGSQGQNVGDMSGPSFSTQTFSDDPTFAGPNTFADPYGDFTGPQTTAANSFAALDTPGLVGSTGVTSPGLSRGTDVDEFLQGLPNIVAAVPDPFEMNPQAITAFELGEQGRGPVEAPAINPLNVAPAQQQTLNEFQSPINQPDVNSLINAYPGLNQAPAPADAKGLFGELNPNTPTINSLMEALTNLVGGPNQAQAQTISSPFGRGPSDEIASQLQAPTTSQQGLANTFAATLASNQQTAQSNPGLANALATFADPEAPGRAGPISEDPEVGRTMEAPHTVMTDPGRTVAEQNQPSISEFWEGTPSISRGAEIDPGRTMEAPHTVMTDPGRTMTMQDQPSIAEFWEGTPSISRSSETGPYGPESTSRGPVTQDQINQAYQEAQSRSADPFANVQTAPPGMTNPNIAPTWFTQEMQTAPLSFPTSFPAGRDPVAINPQDIPTPEQMQTARDALTQQLQDQARGPTNQPSIEEFWEGTPSISRSAEVDPGRTMEQPHTVPTQQEMQEIQEEEQRGRDLEEQEQRALERMAEPPPSIPLPTPNPLTPAERAQVDRAPTQITVSPSRGQERGAPGRSGLSAPGRGLSAPGRGAPASLGRGTDRGTGRDSPGVQGLPAGLRGNDLAQALVSRGFDPNMVGAALTIGDRGAMLTAMLEAAGLSHAQAVATATAARGEVAAQHGIPSGNVNTSGVARSR